MLLAGIGALRLLATPLTDVSGLAFIVDHMQNPESPVSIKSCHLHGGIRVRDVL